jgi:hypothetical protein
MTSRTQTLGGISAKVDPAEFEHLRRKLLAIIGPKAEAEIGKANMQNAEDMARTARSAVPRGDPELGHLANTITARQTTTTAAEASIGDENYHYPLHLEVGHRARDGSHVPAKAFWFPSRRLVKKRTYGRLARAERKAIKAIAGGGK